MKSKSLVLAAAVISLGVFSGCRYEMIRTHNENQRGTEAVFRIDKFTGQVSRCHMGRDSRTLATGLCIDIQESQIPLGLMDFPLVMP